MYYKKDAREVMTELSTDLNGLSESQVSINRKKYGSNKIEEKKKKSVFEIFIDQFKDLLVIILIIAAIISMITGSYESTAVSISVLILNAVLGLSLIHIYRQPLDPR